MPTCADLLGQATVPPRALDAALGKLEGLALVRGTDQIHMPSAVLAVLGPYPAGLGSPGALTVDEADGGRSPDLDPTAARHARSAGQRSPQGHHRLPVVDRAVLSTR